MSDTNQTVLFEHTDESAFFQPPEVLRKRYTSEQVQGIETKRSAVVLLVSYGCPVEVIARELGMNVRTVSSIVARDGVKVAGFRKEYAEALLRSGAGDFAVADTKKHDASYLQLVTGAGIKTDKAIALLAMGEVGEEKSVKEDQDHVATAQALRRMMGPAESQSGDLPRIGGGNEGGGAAGGAGQAGPAAGAGLGAGGGSGGPPSADESMGSPNADLSAKG